MSDGGARLDGRRVGVVTTSYPREPGDPAGHFVAGFSRWLAEAGAAVEVIAAGPGTARLDGIAIHRVPGWNLFYAGGAPDALGGHGLRLGAAWLRAAAFQARLAAVAAARAAEWQGVVSHWLAPSALAVEAALGARRRRVPHVAIAHSSDVWMLRRTIAGRAAMRLLARRADLVYAGAHLASAVDNAPGRVVPMGIDAASLRPEPGARERGRRRFLLHRNNDVPAPVVALFLGRLVPVKGLDLLLDALPPDMTLLVAGDGPMRDRWRQAAEAMPNVRFLGEVRGDDKRDLLAAADLLVVPSLRLPDGRQEGTPTVIFEARAAGLPIVATRTGGAEHVIRDGDDGLLVEPEAAELRRALERLLAEPDLRRRLAGGADADAHDWSRIGPLLARHLL